MGRYRQPGRIADQHLDHLERAKDSGHAAGAADNLLVAAAEMNHPDRAFEVKNAGGLRGGDFAHAVAEDEGRGETELREATRRRNLDREYERLGYAGLFEAGGEAGTKHCFGEGPACETQENAVNRIELLTENRVRLIGDPPHARPLPAIA